MKNILKVFRTDVKRISTNVVAVVVILGLCVIPSLYAWFNILSNWDPYNAKSTGNIKVAVYSNDRGTQIDGVDINIGDNVIEALKSNNSLGWVFTDSESDAVNGVYSGSYYAALVIPDNFTDDMISFMSGSVEHPQISYYENEKKNAIAPKITSKAKTTVQQQVNSTFVSTLAETLLKVSNATSGGGVSSASIIDVILTRLNDLDDDMQSYVNVLGSFYNITTSASSLIDTSQSMIPNLNSMVDNSQNTVNTLQGAVNSGAGNASALADVISASLESTSDNLSSVNSMVQSDLAALQGSGLASNASIEAAKKMMPLVKQLFDESVKDFKDDPTVAAQITTIDNQMDKIISDLNDVSVKSSEGSAALKQLETEISTEMQSCMTQIKNLTDTYNYSVKPQLNSTMNSLQGSLNQTQSVLYGVNGDFGEVSEVLNQYQAALNQGSASLSQSLTATKEMKAELDKIIVQLTELSTNKEYQEFVKLLKTDPTLLGDFVSSPVTMDTEQIYQIDNYGSAMASFYTVLALWVGALILVAIIHVKVHLEEDIPGIKDYQTFFGRYITFYLVGQVQTLITVLGNLFYLKIQCHNPFLFGLACSVTSFVFTLIMYSLTVALGNIGEALAIVIMVVQVAGAGGSFPVEVLPKIYQAIYRYLPFTYAMNALRETIGGMYGIDYWKYLLILSSFTIFSLIIGLALAVPFRKLNTMIEKSKKNTDIMV